MPKGQWFAYCWPNRRSDKTVVEITLDFTAADQHSFPQDVTQVRDLLVKNGILAVDETFPERNIPDERMAWYTSLLAQTALLFQRKAGHRVDFVLVTCGQRQNRCVALVEHEHCDVGMTAVKLAVEMMSGKRKLLEGPFRMFREFAQQRRLPRITEAIIEAARRQDIPAIKLERSPYKRADFENLTGGKTICRNGLIMLGYGKYQQVLDGTWSIDLQEDLSLDVSHSEIGSPDETADRIVQRLFPSQAPGRMPVIAVTGTNGKTTTVRMINHIMQRAGRKPGMVCTDGVYVDSQEIDKGDICTDTGHLRVLTNKDVNIAVLETHHAGILARGFCFDWCDIAICLNVSEDHLGVFDVDTVGEMAAVKRALPERARHVVVLNADDDHCLAMIDAVRAAKLCLVSMKSTTDELQQYVDGQAACLCVLEQVEGQDWLLIHDGGENHRVMPVAQIPATFDGAARFNVSNVMHAIVASYLAGVDAPVIRAAMRSFASGYKSTPGRLNVFDELPFRIVMDFAHNPHGMRELCKFTDRQVVEGRKIVVFSGSVDRRDNSIRNMGRSVAGHFDLYICKEYVHRTEKNPRKVAHLLEEGLLHAGIAQEKIMVTSNGKDVIFGIFDICEPGDLLVMLLGHVEKNLLPGYIKEYASGVG